MRARLLLQLSFAAFTSIGTASGQRIVDTLAGTGLLFQAEGKAATEAPLGRVSYVSIDPSGQPVFSDPYYNMVFRLNADRTISVIAGNNIEGYSGDGARARFASLSDPLGTAYDTVGNLYIADAANNRVRMVTPQGIISTIVGSGVPGYRGDGGAASQASLNSPISIALDRSNNLFINDQLGRVIRKVTNGVITTVAGTGQPGYLGENTDAKVSPVNDVEGMTVDRDGNLYFAEFSGHRVRKLTTGGRLLTVAGTGQPGFSGDGGAALTAKLDQPSGLTIDNSGNLYIVDTSNQRIRKITNSGSISTVSGTGSSGFSGDGGPASNATLRNPIGVAVNSRGELFIADRDNFRVRFINTQGTISTVAGNAQLLASQNNVPSKESHLVGPYGVSLDRRGNLLLADTGSNLVRRVNLSLGTIQTVAGNGAEEYSGDGGPATAAGLYNPIGTAFDSFTDSIIVADSLNNCVRRINADGEISTLAGVCGSESGKPSVDDGAKATQAKLNFPTAVVPDGAGNIYIADCFNDSIRKVNSSGFISTFGGNALQRPFGLAIDRNGNLLVTELVGRVRRITLTGTVATVAGGGTTAGLAADSGLALNAKLNEPAGIAVDDSGTIYFTDAGDHLIRQIDTGGVLTTLGGTGQPGFSGDGGSALRATFTEPFGLAIDRTTGNLYVADQGNDRIRVLYAPSLAPSLDLTSSGIQMTATSGGTVVDAAPVDVTSSLTGLSFTTESDQLWLQVSPGQGHAPNQVHFTVDPTALAPGVYTAMVTVRAEGANPGSRRIPVKLTVAQEGEPKLQVSKEAIVFTLGSGADPESRQVAVQNVGGKSLSFSGAIVPPVPGLVVSGPGLATASQPGLLTLTIDPTGMASGTFTSFLKVSAGSEVVSIPLNVTVGARPGRILISQSAVTITAVEQGTQPPASPVMILNPGKGTLEWNVSSTVIGDFPNWLTTGSRSGTASGAGSSPSLLDLRADPSGLSPGEYYGQIVVTSTQADNSPQLITVVLKVLPHGTKVAPQITPSALVFVGHAGESPESQDLQVFNASDSVIQYRLGVGGKDGERWLTVVPTSATLAPGAKSRMVVQPDYSQLLPGVYRNSLNVVFSDGSSQLVEVVSLVNGRSGVTPQVSARASNSCALQNPVFTSLPENFQVITGQTVPITFRVYDCQNSLVEATGKTATLQFVGPNSTNLDKDMRLNAMGPGTWSGDWTPPQSAAGSHVILNARLFSSSSQIPEARLNGTVIAASTKPAARADKVLNAASSVEQQVVAPGTLVSIYGAGLAEQDGAASGVPLSTELNGTEVRLGIQPLPLLYTSDGQVNAQIPFELPVNTALPLSVRRGSTLSAPQTISIGPSQPAVFTVDQSGSGQGDIFGFRKDGSLTLADATAPVTAGDTVVIYGNGLGPVVPQVAPGTVSPSNPLAKTTGSVTVLIGGRQASASFSGLTPGSVGLYQVNAVIPSGVITGNAVELVIQINGQTSPPVTLAIR